MTFQPLRTYTHTALTYAPYDERPTEPHVEVIAELKDRILELREHYGDTDEEHPEVLDVMRDHWED